MDVGYEIKQNTDKKGVDLSIDTSSHTLVLQAAIRSTAYGGKVTIVGWYKELKGHLNLGRETHFNIPEIIFSRACSEPNRDHPPLGFREDKQDLLADVITRTL